METSNIGTNIIFNYINNQTTIYDSKSYWNHVKWYFLVFISIFGAAGGGLCATVISHNTYIRVLLGLPSVLASVAAAINSAMNYRGERVRQASTSEALKNERLRFDMQLKPYDVPLEQRLKYLTEAVLAITGKEVASWVKSHQKVGDKEKPSGL